MPLTHGSECRMRSPQPAKRPALPFYLNTSIEIFVSILNSSVTTFVVQHEQEERC